MIKAVIFDFFGVLCTDEFWQFVKEDKNRPGHFSDLAQSVNSGEISWDNFLKKISYETGQTTEAAHRLYESESFNLPLIAYIENLHKKYKTAILSNASQDFFSPLLKQAGIEKFFDEIVVSSTIGIVKPNPKIFEYVVQKLGVEARQCVFIDDIQRYLLGAESLGMKTIRYQNFPQMKTELEKILVPVADN